MRSGRRRDGSGVVTKTGYVAYLAAGFELSTSEVSAGKADQAAGVLAHALALEKDAFVRYHIASALSLVASRMSAGDAAQICGDSARALADAVPGEASDFGRQQLVSAIVRLVSQIEAREAATIIGTTAKALSKMLESDPSSRSGLASSLVTLAGSMEPTEAANFYVSTIARHTDSRRAPWKSYQSMAKQGAVDQISLFELIDAFVTAAPTQRIGVSAKMRSDY